MSYESPNTTATYLETCPYKELNSYAYDSFE